jgi:hypothetical protein
VYWQASNIAAGKQGGMSMYKKFKIVLFSMAIISPIGLIAEGTAWGEWGAQDIEGLLGYVPQGMNRLGDFWQALFPDYTIALLGKSGGGQSIGYILSAIIGSLLVYGLTILLTKFLVRKNKAACESK